MTDKPKLSLTAPQHTSLSLVELSIHSLMGTASALNGLGAKTLHDSVVNAIRQLEKAHGDFIAETQRTVSIAAPSDVARLVAAP